jgi:carboxyl-terminal processing protease
VANRRVNGRRTRVRGAFVYGAIIAACVTAAADAAENLSFDADAGVAAAAPVGWTTRGDGYAFAIDSSVAVDGPSSLRISGEASAGMARATQRIVPPAFEGNRFRVSAYVKTDSVNGTAGLTVRIDSAHGLLYVDGMQDRGATGTADWTRYVVEAPKFDSAAHVEIGATLRGSGTAWFDRIEIEGFDTAELPPPAPAAARYVERALDILERNSIRRSAIDWPSFRTAVLKQARGAAAPADTYPALRFALGSLGDHHSYLLTPERTAALAEAPVSNARTGRAPMPPRGSLLDGIAYVWLPGFAGGSAAKQVEFAEQVQQTIRQLDAAETCGWIVDLRDNTGGNLWPMLAGIGPLIGDGEAASADYPDGRRVPLWYRDGRAGLGDYVQLRVAGAAYELRTPQPYVAVLQGPRTASSGEVIAAAFRGLPRHRSFGSATRGLSSGNRTFDLSDGAALVLTVAATRDRTGRSYVGALEADEPTARDAADTPLPSQHAVGAAIRWLRQHCAAL